jgi:6-phosphogluconolactonase
MEGGMSFKVEVFGADEYPAEAARVIAAHLPASGCVVLTGGTTAQKIYPHLAEATSEGDGRWSELIVGFSDERCVPPDHEESNFKFSSELLLNAAGPKEVLRMKGEEEPEEGARLYDAAIRPVVSKGIDLLLLGMGADAHIGAMFPHSPVLKEQDALARAVDRPDGMKGITLTPSAMLTAKTILLLVTGEGKADTVKRALQGSEPPEGCPVRLLADHPDVTFLLDAPAASAL